MVTFTVIIPTVGRPTLRHALASVAPQLRDGDAVHVLRNSDGDYGNRARNEAIAQAVTSHLCFLDDDDEWLPGALDSMRTFAEQHPDRVGIFRARYDALGDTGAPQTLAHVGTPLLVVPNVRGKVGRFGPADVNDPLIRPPRQGETAAELAAQFSDYEFLRSTLEGLQSEPVFVAAVTTVIRPERARWRRLRYRLAAARRRLRSV
jgi:glycosyltransferase involved in cell wall biosynthesis